MNCAEFEQLIDAYLDGELAGSLRVEFDAHRLRCRRCQLTMVAMESVETVLANDRPLATLSDDFTERVMGAIERRRPLSLRLRPTRIALAAGALLQAAAVIFLAIYPWHGAAHDTNNAVASSSTLAARAEAGAARNLNELYQRVDRKTELHQALVDEIFGKLEAAGMNVATDWNQLVRYASALPVPDDLARATDGINGANPLNVLFDVIVPGAAPELESPPVGTDEHAL
jgi:hypothetical protein